VTAKIPARRRKRSIPSQARIEESQPWARARATVLRARRQARRSSGGLLVTAHRVSTNLRHAPLRRVLSSASSRREGPRPAEFEGYFFRAK
jgi:hypothetical protein